MPKVGKKHFPYTPAGKKAAAKARKSQVGHGPRYGKGNRRKGK